MESAGRFMRLRFRQPALLRSDWKAVTRPLRVPLREPHFLALAGVLLVAAASWQTVMRAAGAIFVKKPVPLRQMLDRFPREVRSADGGRWIALDGPGRDEQLSPEDELLEEDVEKFLGAVHPYRLRGEKSPVPGEKDPADLLLAPQYIQRYYRYVDRTGTEVSPALRAYLFVSYYTGSPDPVPHVPDRCYLGGGFQELASQDVTVPVNGQTVPIRRMAFGKDLGTTNVIYFFHYNGRKSSRHLEVRNYLNNPLIHHAYFSKIEVKFPRLRGEDLEAATVATQKLLTDFLPVLEGQYLPDWKQYEQADGGTSNLAMALVPAGLGGAVLIVVAVLLLRRRGRRAAAD